MIKASALYIVIIIALVIGVICSSLIVAAYFYKTQYQKKFRYDQLENNLNSGINILLASNDSAYSAGKTVSLFNNDADSVILKQISWGVYDIGIAEAFIQKDTLFKSFSIANAIDSTKWAALYLIDEDRPFSLSGKTTIRGDAYIPKAGVQEAYVDNKAYEGDKRLIIGKRHVSDKKLPSPDQNRLNKLEQYFNADTKVKNMLPKVDSVNVSFLSPTRVFNFKKVAQIVQNVKLSGNIILVSDTTVTIDNTAVLINTMVFARAIIVKSGFQGNCQLFATDSISVENNCHFDYPSCMGVLLFGSSVISNIEKISIGESTDFNGIVFSYEKTERPIKPLIQLGKNVKIKGQVYSQGNLQLKAEAEVDGSIFTNRFLYKNTFTLFENYLINATLDSKALSPYYLTSGLLPVSAKKKKVLQWLEAN
jgi:cytoskeletal protein CcmA (bactofilin family)